MGFRRAWQCMNRPDASSWRQVNHALIIMAAMIAPSLAVIGPTTAAEVIARASPAQPAGRPDAARGTAARARKAPNTMTWGGGQFVGGDWSVYSGTAYALSGNVNGDGWRLRMIAGYGRYTYTGARLIAGQNVPTTFHGHTGFSDVMLGYRKQTGNLTIKGFLGAASVTHGVTPFDPDNPTIATDYGVSGALEVWLDLSNRSWLSAETKYATVSKSFSTTLRAGHRLWPAFSLGLEAGILGNADFSAGNGAVFTAYEFDAFNRRDSYLRLSAGVSGDRDMDLKPYASLSYALKY